MPSLSEESKKFFVVFYCFVLLTGVFGNVCVLYSLFYSRENRKKVQNFYIVTLAMTDLLYCCTFPPYNISSLVGDIEPLMNETVCKTMVFVNYGLALVSLFAVTALSLDRYVAVVHPFTYQRFASKWTVLLVNAIAWAQPLGFMVPLLAENNWAKCFEISGMPSGVDYFTVPLSYTASVIGLCFVLPGLILIVTNITVFRVSKKQTLKIRDQQKPIGCVDNTVTVYANQAQRQSQIRPSRIELFSLNQYNLSESNHVLEITGTSHADSTVCAGGISANAINSSGNGAWVGKGRHSFASKAKSLKQVQFLNDWRVAVMTLALVIGFFVTWLPFAITRGITAFRKNVFSLEVEIATAAFTTVNSLSNPYIVLATRKDIRKVLFKRTSQMNNFE